MPGDPADDSAVPGVPRWAHAASGATFFAGGSLGLVFLSSIFPAPIVLLVAAILTAAYVARPLARRRRVPLRAVGVLGWILTSAAYALFAYLALAWGSVLYWTVPPWGFAAVAVFAVGVALTAWRPWRGVRIAAALPVGAWIALCLLGWTVEETVVRCDDYRAVLAQTGVEVVTPTTRLLESCAEHEVIPIGRYPRAIWQPPDGERLIVTTQAGIGSDRPPRDQRFDGSVCEVSGEREPVCVGEGKAQSFAEAPALDRLFVGTWGRMAPGVRGQLLVLPRTGPLELREAVDVEGALVEIFHVPSADRVYGFTDEGFERVSIVASAPSREPALEVPLISPARVRYDAPRGEGVVCTFSGPFVSLDGERFVAVALRGDPFELRPLGQRSALTPFVVTWGCDWDPVARRAYVAAPNLGLLITLDYDSGEVLRTEFVGFAMRAITVDAARDRLYVTSFLEGDVVAIRRSDAEEVARWRVGRFPRFTTLTRDGASLLVGTNVGVVSIRLD